MSVKVLSAAALAMFIALPAAAEAPADQAAQIKAVESGLRPGLVVKGETVPLRTLEERMRKYNVPGVSIAVIDHGKIVWTKAYGVVTAGKPEKVTTETRFQAASISKPVSAAAALGLVVEGKLSLDEPVNSKLKGWQIPPSDKYPGYSPTLRGLLSHSAGLGVHGFEGYAVGAPIPTVVQILDGLPPANSPAVRIDGTPGKWSYSGGGTTIAQKLMTDVTGKDFPTLMQERVLGPVGMTHSNYGVLSAANEKYGATGHKGDGKPIEGRWHIYPELAPAALWTTPTDLAKLGLAMTRALHGDGKAGIDPKVAALLTERQPGLDTGFGGMGLGFFLNEEGKAKSFSHGGANEGFRAQFTVYPDTGQGVAVMTNGDTGSSLAAEIIRSVAAAYHWADSDVREVVLVPSDPAVQARFVGTYSVDIAPVTMALRVDGGRLFVRYWDDRDAELRAQPDGSYIDLEDGTVFTLGDQPGVVGVTLASGGKAVLTRKP
jgi:CubicO group peptidase (beta-lactamase class C family)